MNEDEEKVATETHEKVDLNQTGEQSPVSNTVEHASEPKYRPENLIWSGKFGFAERNILKLSLNPDKMYTEQEATDVINNFLERG
jgi:hypothetical protein